MLPVRNYGLDLLRILLCLTVVIFHYSGAWSCGGSVAVDGFFVLSGFLAIHSSGVGRIGAYYRKKAWRLLPVMIVAWIIGNAILFFEGRPVPAWPGIRLLVIAPTLALAQMMENVSAWFIVCMLAFFALFPWVRRCYGKKLFLWLLVASVLFAVGRSGMRPFAVVDSGGLYYQVTFRLWQFLLGMWCASWNMERWRLSWRWFWIGAGAIWLLASSMTGRMEIGVLNYSFPGYAVSSVIFALCMASLWSVSLPSLSKPVLKWVGIGAGMTYALFLLHIPVKLGMDVMLRMMGEFWKVDFREEEFPVLLWVIVLCISFVLAYFTYQYVEVRWVGRKLKKNRKAVLKLWKEQVK